MTAIKPVFRLTVFSPRSEDPTETSVLHPIAGAAHSDPFVITTKQGISGSQPYLAIPKGRQGSIDVITKRTTTGNLTLSAFDPRVTPGGSNAVRWSTAFLGDALGRTRLKGCKLSLERSLDDGASFAPYFAGRIRDTSIARPLWLDLDVKDFADDLTRNIFVGAPHPSVAGHAACAAVLPIGVPQAYGNFAPTERLRGTSAWTGVGWITLDLSQSAGLALITKTLADAGSSSALGIVQITSIATGAVGYFRWFPTLPSTDVANGGAAVAIPGTGPTHYRYINILFEELPTTDPRFTAHAGFVGAVSCYTFFDAPPSPALPLLINDIHPLQHFADVVDGKYSMLPGDTTLYPLGTRDTSSGGPWDVLLSDPSFVTLRDLADATMKGSDYIEKYICQRYNIGYRFDADGKIVPIDLRRTAELTAAVTLTDDDLSTGTEPSWNDSRDGAITAVEIAYYVDSAIPATDITAAPDTYPALSPTMIRSTKSSVVIPNDLTTFRDVGEKIIQIDAHGARAGDGEVTGSGLQSKIDALKADITAAGGDFLRPFATGTIGAKASYRLLGGAAGVMQGTYASVQHTKLPDPATNQRGGARLMLCLSRDDQDEQINIQWLDCGANLVALPPTISAIAASSVSGAVDATVAVNASSDPVEVWAAVTDTSVGTRPLANDAAWHYAGPLLASGVLQVAPLPRGARVWIRARSQGKGAALKIPSAWVFPVTPAGGYIDLAAPAAVSGVSYATLFANRADLSWVIGDATLPVELFLTTGGVPSAWTSAMFLLELVPGTVTQRIGFLAAATQYTVGVCHRDSAGGPSTMATATFTTTSTLGQAPAPLWLALAVSGLAP